ncbi:MAG: type II secretion system protein [Chloroflexi bacterium]|nr:type II secretion system protein [Chloroflexota bacterium]
MSKRVRELLKRGQRGFTLIELVAVMAIMAVLVAVVAPSVTGTRNASIDAQTMQDATQVRSAVTSFYKAQNKAEVRTPHSVTTTAMLLVTGGVVLASDTLAVVTNQAQGVSSRWPERYITLQHTATTGERGVAAAPSKVKQIGAVYPNAIPTTLGDNINSVVLLDKEGRTISGATFLRDYTAVDFDTLVGNKLLGKMPAGSDLESNGIPNFLWLLLKTASSATSSNDSREVVVFKLVKVEKMESTYANERLALSTTLATGTHTGSADAGGLTDSAAQFDTAEVAVGDIITNLTDGSSAAITAFTATTITATLTGGTDNNWDSGDSYRIGNAALEGRAVAPRVVSQADTTNKLDLTYERIF